VKRVVFANRFYWPDKPATAQLLTDLATALASGGWNVTVIASRTSTLHSRTENHRGVQIRRVRALTGSDRTLTRKAIGLLVYALSAWIEVFRQTSRGTIVVAMTDPPLLSYFLGIAVRLRGGRLVYWLQDLYPEIAAAVTGREWLNLLRVARDPLLANADLCVAISGELRTVVREAAPDAHVVVIENWAPSGVSLIPPDNAHVQQFRRQHGWERCFLVGYSGNLGRVHDLDPVIAAARMLEDSLSIHLVLIGDGPQRDALQSRANTEGLTNVSFLDAVPREQLAASLAGIDLHLVTLRRGCERYVYPSKFYGIVAAGRPILFVGPPECEMARAVVATGVGLVVDSRTPRDIASAIRHLATDALAVGRLTAAARKTGHDMGADRATAKWIRALEQLHAC